MRTNRLKCPLGRNVCEQCLWYVTLTKFTDDNKPVQESKCAMLWLPELMIENSRLTHSGVAATESFRNEMVKGNGQLAAVMFNALGGNGEQSRLKKSD